VLESSFGIIFTVMGSRAEYGELHHRHPDGLLMQRHAQEIEKYAAGYSNELDTCGAMNVG
jgi:hypothetical protein